MGREEMAVNGGMKKWVGRQPKREELLRNGFREEIGLPITDTGHREWLSNGQSKLQKEWLTGDGENDWGMILGITKSCFEKQ